MRTALFVPCISLKKPYTRSAFQTVTEFTVNVRNMCYSICYKSPLTDTLIVGAIYGGYYMGARRYDMNSVFDDFTKISDHFPKISERLENLSEGQMNIATFSENLQTYPKVPKDCQTLLRKTQRCFDHTPGN